MRPWAGSSEGLVDLSMFSDEELKEKTADLLIILNDNQWMRGIGKDMKIEPVGNARRPSQKDLTRFAWNGEGDKLSPELGALHIINP